MVTKKDFELEELRHKNRMEELADEFKGKKEIERIKFDNEMSLHRLKRRDIMNTLEAKRHLRETRR